ncbi:MAG: thiamine phosphate synthase [Chloroflexi bacterium]|jgi:thiamine-phosphate pyrophosphorylase|nr:thiamine phosphate synthase [Chloroflexota bacterium]MBT5319123.1 thiamine phosphate synthase [Chloroflexota bacterium]MBT6682917.1 thiamine phosphate synthase [Chloroflexota bacterium]
MRIMDATTGLKGLYVIVDPEHTDGRTPEDITRAALSGGATVIQLRDKISDKGPMLETATRITELCNEAGALHFMNDHADIAVLSGAHGLHVGQTDLPVSAARRVLGDDQMIGTSNHAMQEALVSISDAVDYVAVGAIYGTATKEVTVSAGLETLGEIRARIDSPIAAIGGINASNIRPVIEAGAEMACVITAVCMAPDPEAASRELVRLIEQSRA